MPRAETVARFSVRDRVLLERLALVVAALQERARHRATFEDTRDPERYFNTSLEFAVAAYAAKFCQLYESAEHAIDLEWYLMYAQAARSILENIATLRYYCRHEAFTSLKSAWGTEQMSDAIMRKANAAVDRLNRGHRFSWNTYFDKKFDRLSKKPDREDLAQINVQTCLDKWYKDTPAVEPLYNLLCDMVHPNLGSTFLVMRTDNGKVVAGGRAGVSGAHFTVVPTLAGITGCLGEITRGLDGLASFKLEK
jgi:hypothetical protein